VAVAWGKWVGIGCGAALVIIVTLVVVLFFVVKTLTAGPEQVARQFLDAAAAGNYPAAHAAFSAPLKERQSLQAFAETAAAQKSLFAIADFSFNERSINLETAKLAGTATLKSGTVVPVSFEFVQENRAWKLIAYHIGATE
jgi:hypothetical protein